MTAFSYQLYSSRNHPPLGDTFAMLARLGYTQVEGFGGIYAAHPDVGALKGMLDANGLWMSTGHFGLPMVQTETARVLEIARGLGLKAVIVPFLAADDRPKDAAGWAAFGRVLAEAGKPIRDAGLAFGWHNHAFEFDDLGGADRPLDLILGASDSVSLELDLAWARVAGEDPVAWIGKYADRLVAAHLKDIAPEGQCADEDGWADVGHGTMDWPAIMAALRATDVQFLIMEHDLPSDDERFARRSMEAAQSF